MLLYPSYKRGNRSSARWSHWSAGGRAGIWAQVGLTADLGSGFPGGNRLLTSPSHLGPWIYPLNLRGKSFNQFGFLLQFLFFLLPYLAFVSWLASLVAIALTCLFTSLLKTHSQKSLILSGQGRWPLVSPHPSWVSDTLFYVFLLWLPGHWRLLVLPLPFLLPVSGSSSHPSHGLPQPSVLSVSLCPLPQLPLPVADLESTHLVLSSHLSSNATVAHTPVHILWTSPRLNNFPWESSFPIWLPYICQWLFSQPLSNLSIICDSVLSSDAQGHSIIHQYHWFHLRRPLEFVPSFPFLPPTTSAHRIKPKLFLSGNLRLLMIWSPLPPPPETPGISATTKQLSAHQIVA